MEDRRHARSDIFKGDILECIVLGALCVGANVSLAGDYEAVRVAAWTATNVSSHVNILYSMNSLAEYVFYGISI